jgi:YbbR domain-containing protein
MKEFWAIISVPDNIPIVALLLAALFFVYVSFVQAFRNDRLIKEGREDEIYDEMIK